MSRPYILNDDEHENAMRRILELFNCKKGSPEEKELENLVDMIEEYEGRRFPFGVDLHEEGLDESETPSPQKTNRVRGRYSNGMLNLPPR